MRGGKSLALRNGKGPPQTKTNMLFQSDPETWQERCRWSVFLAVAAAAAVVVLMLLMLVVALVTVAVLVVVVEVAAAAVAVVMTMAVAVRRCLRRW